MNDEAIAAMLISARGGPALATPPEISGPAQAYRVQALVMAGLGEIGGWKVGAPSPDGPISCAPLPANTIFPSPHDLDPAVFTQREVESEICFRLKADLPLRQNPPCQNPGHQNPGRQNPSRQNVGLQNAACHHPYSRDEVLAALGTCHPGIEVLQSRFADPDSASSPAMLADFLQNGAYILGQPIEAWRSTQFATMDVIQTIEHGPTKHARGNPAGDMTRLLLWLANEGAAWAGGVRAGQVLTCGSWTGKTQAPPGSTVVTRFAGAAPVTVRFRDG